MGEDPSVRSFRSRREQRPRLRPRRHPGRARRAVALGQKRQRIRAAHGGDRRALQGRPGVRDDRDRCSRGELSDMRRTPGAWRRGPDGASGIRPPARRRSARSTRGRSVSSGRSRTATRSTPIASAPGSPRARVSSSSRARTTRAAPRSTSARCAKSAVSPRASAPTCSWTRSISMRRRTDAARGGSWRALHLDQQLDEVLRTVEPPVRVGDCRA